MSTITGENLIAKNNALLWAAGAFVFQTLIVAGPLFVRVGNFETRLAAAEATLERNRGEITDTRERLVRIETKQEQILEAVKTIARR